MKHKITIEFDDPGHVTVSSETKPSGSYTLVALTHSLAAIIQKCADSEADRDHLKNAVVESLNAMIKRCEAEDVSDQKV